MSKIIWKEVLGWTDEHIDDLRDTGYSYIRQGKYEIALPFFEALQILDPNNPYDLQILGAVYLELNQHQSALRYINRSLKLAQNHPPTLLNLTKLFFTVGKKEEGLKIAHALKNHQDVSISSVARALILAYE